MADSRHRLINIIAEEIHNTNKTLTSEQIREIAINIVDKCVLQLDANLISDAKINMNEIKFECMATEVWRTKTCDKNCQECDSYKTTLSFSDMLKYDKQIKTNAKTLN